MRGIRERLSYANVMATLAVFMVLGGGAYAVSKNSIGTKQLKGHSVGTHQLKEQAVKNNKIKKKTIKNSRVKKETLKGNRLKDSSISSSKLSDVETFGNGSFVKVIATEGATVAAARDAAPEVTLFKKGPLSITYKCFYDTSTSVTWGEIYGKTDTNMSLLDGEDNLDGGQFNEYLNPDTAAEDRRLDEAYSDGGSTTPLAWLNEDEYALMAVNGTSLIGSTGIAVKSGELPGGPGPYGSGNVCLFTGYANG